MRGIRLGAIVLVFLVVLPAAAHAQGSLRGVVRDSSGAVLPGVTVEAASPVLIEKVRSAVTDGSGQYLIVDLRPGSYTVTFTLTGFNTVRRQGVELSGSFTATVNVDLQVGTLEETITVTGEGPTVDIQNATRQRVLDPQAIAEIPTGRVFANLAILIPGVSQSGEPDVGGSLGANMTDLVSHGSKNADQRIMQNGISLSTNVNGRAGAVPNMAAFQEVTIDSGAADASIGLGGVRINFIPREGGNTFRGSGFFGFANSAMQGSNLTQRLKDQGLQTPTTADRVWDFNPGFGGPIVRDRIWYYATFRHQGAWNQVANLWYNANANKLDQWAYVPDYSRPALNKQIWSDGQIRVTTQVTPKNKLAITWDMQDINGNWPFGCDCKRINLDGAAAPEANSGRRFPLQRALLAEWTSPVTNRVLLESVAIQRVERHATDDHGLGYDDRLISVTEQGGLLPGLTYRASSSFGYNLMWTLYYRGAMSYITGSHALKVGFTGQTGHNYPRDFAHQPVSYRFNNGVPNQITLRALARTTPVEFAEHTRYQWDMGFYAQDRWTRDRLTLGYGLRFDGFWNTIPEQTAGPTPLTPNRNITFPAQENLAWKDLSPKFSAVYDLFGTGKTALKGSLNRYVASQTTSGLASAPGARQTIVSQTTRSWNDANQNYIPDCDLINPLQNGECGTMANTNFGTPVPGAVYDPELLRGWFRRSSNWEFSVGVQHELLPRVSVDVSYFRRWYGNFTATDDLALAASDFDAFSITAPVDSRLPDGGGQTISGLYNLSQAKFGTPTRNYVTRASNFGEQIEQWSGGDVTVSARLQGGLLLQGGLGTGKTTTDSCAVRAALPESSPTSPYCRVETAYLTQVKALGAYTIPRVDVLVSGTFQSIPGPQVSANFTATNAVIAPSLGRNLSGGVNNLSINVVEPGAMYGERLNQLDLRVGKIFRFGRHRATANFDVYNATNADTVLSESTNFASFRRPQSILQARFVKVSLQWDF